MLLLGSPGSPSRVLPRLLAGTGALLVLGLGSGVGLTNAAALSAPPRFPPAIDAPVLPATTTFGVQASSELLPDSRPHFAYTALPGVSITDFLAVSNYSNAPVSLQLYAGDAFTNSDGGFDLTPSASKPRDIGSWVTLGNPGVTLAPRTRSILPFRLVVPADASPGDHTGGVIASLTTTSRGTTGEMVTVEHRLAERIYLRVPGAQRPRLSVVDLGADYRSNLNPFGRGLATARYRLVNTGNVRLGAKLSATVSDVSGSRVLGHGQDVPELLPGSSLAVNAGQVELLPLGRATARIRVEPVNLGAATDAKGPVVTASVDVWTVPVSVLAGLGALAAAGVAASALLRGRLRLRRRPTGSHASRTPAGSTGPAHARKVGTS